MEKQGKNTNGIKFLDFLFEHPIVSIQMIKDSLHISYPTASTLVSAFCDLGILKVRDEEKRRSRIFEYKKYVDILDKGT
jgi:hypothetical protein